MWNMVKVRDLAIDSILKCRVGVNDQKVLLRLSTKLRITKIRNLAIQTLFESLRPIELVQFGIDCYVRAWLLEGYKQLVEMPGGISAEDETQLGWQTTSKLFRIREDYLTQESYHSTRTVLNRIFAQELQDAEWAGG
jgi:hypothetical protein